MPRNFAADLYHTTTRTEWCDAYIAARAAWRAGSISDEEWARVLDASSETEPPSAEPEPLAFYPEPAAFRVADPSV